MLKSKLVCIQSPEIVSVKLESRKDLEESLWKGGF